MQYTITRGTQTYGPYTLEDLERYVASGNILPTDMAQSDDMAETRPVAELLGSHLAAANTAPYPSQSLDVQPAPIADGTQPPVDPAASPNAPFLPAPGFQPPAAYAQPAAYTPYPDPPGLHWGLVLLFSFLTCGLFIFIWNLVVSAWLRRVQPNANALFFYIAAYVLALLNQVVSIGMSARMALGSIPPTRLATLGVVVLVVWVLRLIARFSEKASIEEHYRTVEPLGLELNGVLVFFFGGIYIQSQLNKVPQLRQQAAYGYNRGY